MGYSISVQTKNKDLHDKMLKFMDSNFKPYHELANEEYGGSGVPLPGDDLAYDDGDLKIGFNYSSWIDSNERHYMFSVLRWIALQIGEYKDFSDTIISKYLIYDGEEEWPVIDEELEVEEEYKWAQYNKLGTYSKRNKYHIINRPTKKIFNMTMSELSSLDRLWKQS